MQTDFLIVGHGISGAILFYKLTAAGANCIVIDEGKPNTASKVAAGLINPVTGRRLVKSWMIDELLPEVKKTYEGLGKSLNIKCLHEKELSWFFPAIDVLQSFEKRITEQPDYLGESDALQLLSYFNYPYKAGNIKPCYVTDLQQLLPALTNQLTKSNKLINEKFNHDQLIVTRENVRYKDIGCKKIIFCEGSSAINNPWFDQLPYSLNKGEALIVEIKDLPRHTIYKFKQTLVPLPENENLWWYGSNYTWEFADENPTAGYKKMSEQELTAWLKLPFKIVDHKAAVRYATVERRPFIGFHPSNPNIGIFNGWGTKGCSLVPFFAGQFINHILNNEPLMPEVDVKRFGGTLMSRRES